MVAPQGVLAHGLGTIATASLFSPSSPWCRVDANSVLCLRAGALQEVLSSASWSKGRKILIESNVDQVGDQGSCSPWQRKSPFHLIKCMITERERVVWAMVWAHVLTTRRARGRLGSKQELEEAFQEKGLLPWSRLKGRATQKGLQGSVEWGGMVCTSWPGCHLRGSETEAHALKGRLLCPLPCPAGCVAPNLSWDALSSLFFPFL